MSLNGFLLEKGSSQFKKKDSYSWTQRNLDVCQLPGRLGVVEGLVHSASSPTENFDKPMINSLTRLPAHQLELQIPFIQIKG